MVGNTYRDLAYSQIIATCYEGLTQLAKVPCEHNSWLQLLLPHVHKRLQQNSVRDNFSHVVSSHNCSTKAKHSMSVRTLTVCLLMTNRGLQRGGDGPGHPRQWEIQRMKLQKIKMP